MSLKSQVARGLKWQMISIVGRQLLSLAVFTTLARLLDPSAFGLIALVGVYLGFVSMFTDQGLGAALIQKEALDQEHLDTAFWFNLTCGIVLCIGSILLAEPIAAAFKEPRLAPLLRWSSLGLVLGASAAIHSTLFTREMDFRRPATRTLIANTAGGAAGIVMAFAGFDVWSLVGQQLISSFAGAAFLWKASKYRPGLKFSVRHLRELFGFSSSVFGTTLLWYFSSRLDQMAIGRFNGAPALGVYSIAGKIPTLVRAMTQQPLSRVTLSSFSRLQGDYEKMRQAIYKGMELNALVSFALYIGIAAVSTDLVYLLFGPNWAAAGTLCALLSIHALITGLQSFCHPALLASGGPGSYVLLNVWHLLGVVLACGAGIYFGVTALIWGLILNGIIIVYPSLFYLKRRIGLEPLAYCQPCIVPAGAAGLMWLAVWGFENTIGFSLPLVFRISCKVLLGSVVYVGFIWLIAPGTLTRLWQMLMSAKGRAKPSPKPSISI